MRIAPNSVLTRQSQGVHSRHWMRHRFKQALAAPDVGDPPAIHTRSPEGKAIIVHPTRTRDGPRVSGRILQPVQITVRRPSPEACVAPHDCSEIFLSLKGLLSILPIPGGNAAQDRRVERSNRKAFDMNRFLLGSALALTLSSTSLCAAPIATKAGATGSTGAEQVWLAKGNGNGNGHGGNGKKLFKKGHGKAGKGTSGHGKAEAGNGHGKTGKGHAQAGNGKPDHAGGPPPGANGKGATHGSNGNRKGASGRPAFTSAEREDLTRRLVSTPAPAGRDMARLAGATALALATPQLLVADIPKDELIAYSNCPPGLAKKDPPLRAAGSGQERGDLR
ncbi:hypothetical protein [Alloyangia mangrovi]|uniref:hypothetical protein n=1 Tax=Alloyangia mangrovi TaxID=1779329 RepID=UPI0021A27246|nr:hypothetical protein [Alloyangia mangrovi]